jgi:hypothetical protein
VAKAKHNGVRIERVSRKKEIVVPRGIASHGWLRVIFTVYNIIFPFLGGVLFTSQLLVQHDAIRTCLAIGMLLLPMCCPLYVDFQKRDIDFG